MQERRAWPSSTHDSDLGLRRRQRSLLGLLGEHATVEDLTPEAVRACRDALEHADRTPATIAKYLSAIRGFAAAVGADAEVRTVRSASVARGEPRALSHEEFAPLLKMPDRRTRRRSAREPGQQMRGAQHLEVRGRFWGSVGP